jgi:CRISPR system Cascade subunit CasC
MDHQGAAHMGTLEYNSATYYRYISLDLGQLFVNLDNNVEAVYKAVDVFTKALFVAVPIARQNTQSAASLWDYAHILVRKGQRIQLHFDEPIKAEKGGGYLKPSIVSLKKDLEKKERLVGSLYGKKAELIFGENNDYSIDQLCKDLVEQIKV